MNKGLCIFYGPFYVSGTEVKNLMASGVSCGNLSRHVRSMFSSVDLQPLPLLNSSPGLIGSTDQEADAEPAPFCEMYQAQQLSEQQTLSE